MEMVNIKINNMPVAVAPGTTILEAAHQAGIQIPTLCYLKDINEIGACRICMVEVKGARSLVTACVYPVNEGMEVFTNTPKVLESRRQNLELILSTHERKCLSCVKSGKCELQKLCLDYGVTNESIYDGDRIHYDIDDSAPHMIRDNNKCVLCRRCSAVCRKWQDVGVIGANERGFRTNISCAFETPLGETSCVSCGQCIVACPTGALAEKDQTQDVLKLLSDPSKTVIVQTAPATRVTIGEAFGMPIGTNAEGKMVAALRRLGFAKVFDTNFAADLTIMEEATELVDRIQNGGALLEKTVLVVDAAIRQLENAQDQLVMGAESTYSSPPALPDGSSTASTISPNSSPTCPAASLPSRCSAPWPKHGTPNSWASTPRTWL